MDNLSRLKQAVLLQDQTTTDILFRDLYQFYRKLVLFVLSRLLEDKQDILDLCEDCFLELYSHIQDVDNVKSYLCVTAKNKAYSLLRKKQEQGYLDEDIPTTDFHPVAYEFEQWASSIIGEEDYSIIIDHLALDYSFREIAEQRGSKENTVKTRYHRALRKLRKEKRR